MNFREVPALQLFLPFVAGIILYIQWPVTSFAWLFAAIAALIACVILSRLPFTFQLKYGYTFTIGSVVMLFAMGYSLAIAHYQLNNELHFANRASKNDWLLCTLTKDAAHGIKTAKMEVAVEGLIQNEQPIPCKGNILLFISDEHAAGLRYGDKILLRYSGVQLLSAPANPYEFNYKKFLAYRKIYHRAFAQEYDWVNLHQSGGNVLMHGVWRLKRVFKNVLHEVVHGPSSQGVAQSLLLGDREDITDEVLSAYSASGAVHVLSVSGLHVGILFIVLDFLLGFMKNRKWQIAKAVIILAVIWFYASLSGLSPSVLRSATMFTFITIGKASKRHMNVYNTVLLSAFVLLVYDPYLIADVGFQLSYLAVIGIIYFHRWLNNLFYVKNKVLNWVWSVTAVSLSAQLVTFPLGLLYFDQFPNFFLVSNLFVIPLSSIVLVLGIALFSLSFFAPAKFLLGFLLDKSIWLMNEALFKIEDLPFAIARNIHFTEVETLLTYIFIILLAWLFVEKRVELFAVFATMLILLFFSYRSFYKYRDQNLLTFYSTGNEHAVDLMMGDACYQLVSANLSHDMESIRFHLSNNRLKNHLLGKRTVLIPDTSSVFRFDSYSMLYLNGINPHSIDSGTYNFVVIGGRQKLNMKKLLAKITCDTIVLLSDVKKYRGSFWLRDARRYNRKIFSIANQNALQLVL